MLVNPTRLEKHTVAYREQRPCKHALMSRRSCRRDGQQFQSVQRLRAFADDVADMFTNGQVICDSDAENLD